jgi:hypothetical protein
MVSPTSDVDAFAILTKDYDPFNPYNSPNIGNVLTVSVYDCDTSETIELTDV